MSGFLTVLALSLINNIGYKNDLIAPARQEQGSTWLTNIVGRLNLQDECSIYQSNNIYS